MQILIGMVLIACLLGSDPSERVPRADLIGDLSLGLVIVFAVPLAAGFQTLFCRRVLHSQQWSHPARQRTLRRMMNVHLLLWALAALVLLTTAHWPGIVRENWDLDRWPLVDEFVLLVPLAFSLGLSWALFYELGQTEAQPGLSRRLRFVGLRFRVYFVLTLVPLLGICAIRDSGLDWDRLTIAQSGLLVGLLGLVGMAGFPFVIGWIWPTQPIDGAALSRRLQQIAVDHRLRLSGIRIWNTDGQMLNAVLVGFLPHLRFLFLTDALVDRFSDDELAAIVLHEAGHVRHRHLPIRIGFVLAPLIAIAGFESNAMGHSIPVPFGLLAVGYVAWLVSSIAWMSRNMEFEADLYALRWTSPDKQHSVGQALLTLARYMPTQFRRGSLTHPSLAARIEFLIRAQRDPKWADRFRRRFQRQQIALASILALAILAMFGLA